MALIDQYTKKELEQIVQQSSSLKEVIDKLGYKTHSGNNNETVKRRLKEYQIDISHFKTLQKTIRTEENVFVENSTASQATLRRWYKKGEYTSYECSICKLPPLWQNKELTLILDHKDGNNHNNKLENLRWVCPNCNQQLETTGHTKFHTQKQLTKKYYCCDCGKEISKNAERCISCAAKNRAAKELFLSREELKKLIRTKSFSEIGRLYNVSDNAVRKWCDKYNLPRKKAEIKALSDKEWEVI